MTTEANSRQEKRTDSRQVLYWIALAVILVIVVLLLLRYLGASESGGADVVPEVAVATVPNVVGLQSDEAAKALEDAGFEVKSITTYDAYVAEGQVMSQSPEAGTEAAPGITVTIEVAEGGEFSEYPDPTAGLAERTPRVPDVVGEWRGTAEDRLESAGYKVSVSQGYSDEFPPDKVMSQSPSAGTELAEGGIVFITVSLGKAEGDKGTVPSVVGLSQSAAEDRIRAAGFTPYVIPRPAPATKGLVNEQWPEAGEQVPLGSDVYIVVGVD
ncbi:MAG: hypothetical protein Kow0056_11520 [Coriobacteriia bacterium]